MSKLLNIFNCPNFSSAIMTNELFAESLEGLGVSNAKHQVQTKSKELFDYLPLSFSSFWFYPVILGLHLLSSRWCCPVAVTLGILCLGLLVTIIILAMQCKCWHGELIDEKNENLQTRFANWVQNTDKQPWFRHILGKQFLEWVGRWMGILC